MAITYHSEDTDMFTIRDNQLNYIDSCIRTLAQAEQSARVFSSEGIYAGTVHVYRSPRRGFGVGTLVSSYVNGKKV